MNSPWLQKMLDGIEPDQMYSIGEVKDVLGLSDNFVLKILNNGKIGGLKMGKVYRIPGFEVIRYMRECAIGYGGPEPVAAPKPAEMKTTHDPAGAKTQGLVLQAAGLSDPKIAAELNKQGFRNNQGKPYKKGSMQWLLRHGAPKGKDLNTPAPPKTPDPDPPEEKIWRTSTDKCPDCRKYLEELVSGSNPTMRHALRCRAGKYCTYEKKIDPPKEV